MSIDSLLHPLSDAWERFTFAREGSSPNPFKVGDVVEPLRENVVARTKGGDFVFVHPGQRYEVNTLGAGFVLCMHPEKGELVSIITTDLEVML